MKVSSQIGPLKRVHAEDTAQGVRLWATAAGATVQETTIPFELFRALVVNASTLVEHIERKAVTA